MTFEDFKLFGKAIPFLVISLIIIIGIIPLLRKIGITGTKVEEKRKKQKELEKKKRKNVENQGKMIKKDNSKNLKIIFGGVGLVFLLFDKVFVAVLLMFGSVSWYIIVSSWKFTHSDHPASAGESHSSIGQGYRRVKDEIRASIHRESNFRL